MQEFKHLRGGNIAWHLKPLVNKASKRKSGRTTVKKGPSRLGPGQPKAVKKMRRTNSMRQQIEEEESDDGLCTEGEEEEEKSEDSD